MKTLHTISTGILMTIYSLTANSTNTDNTNQLTISIKEIVQPACNGATNGSITVEVNGGKAPYNYNWNTFPNQHNAQATSLKKGIYFIQVTDASGTISYKSIELSDPIIVETKITATSTQPTVTINLQENTGDYNYSYFLNGNPISDKNLSDLDIGIHQLTISDNKNCTVIQYIQVYELEQEEIENLDGTEVKTDIKVSAILVQEINLQNNISMANP